MYICIGNKLICLQCLSNSIYGLKKLLCAEYLTQHDFMMFVHYIFKTIIIKSTSINFGHKLFWRLLRNYNHPDCCGAVALTGCLFFLHIPNKKYISELRLGSYLLQNMSKHAYGEIFAMRLFTT